MVKSKKEESVTKDTDVKKGEAEQKSFAKQPNTLFAGHLSFKVEKYDLYNFFKEVGEIALKLNGKPLLGRKILLDDANKKPPERNIVKMIFVKGSNKSVGRDEMKAALRDHFSDCGEIRSISLPCYQETGDKGMAHLNFNSEGFSKAWELINGSELGGRNIVIGARPKIRNADGNSDCSSASPGRGNGDGFKGGPGEGNGDGRTPSKPNVLASAV